MGIADHESGLEHFPGFVKDKENGISREVIVFHIACRMALHAKPVVFAVKVTGIASDDQIFLREFNIIERLRKSIFLIENQGAGLNRHGVNFSVFQLFVLVKARRRRNRDKVFFAVVLQILAGHEVIAGGIACTHFARSDCNFAFSLIGTVPCTDIAGRVRKEESATAFYGFAIAVPEGSLSLEGNAIVSKVHIAVQHKRTAFACHFKVIRMVHNQR